VLKSILELLFYGDFPMSNSAEFKFGSETEFLLIKVEDEITTFDLSHTVYNPDGKNDEQNYSFNLVSTEKRYITIQVIGDSISIIDSSDELNFLVSIIIEELLEAIKLRVMLRLHLTDILNLKILSST
jgi:hypothetical protein